MSRGNNPLEKSEGEGFQAKGNIKYKNFIVGTA